VIACEKKFIFALDTDSVVATDRQWTVKKWAVLKKVLNEFLHAL
jgi:hypothetical protein